MLILYWSSIGGKNTPLWRENSTSTESTPTSHFGFDHWQLLWRTTRLLPYPQNTTPWSAYFLHARLLHASPYRHSPKANLRAAPPPARTPARADALPRPKPPPGGWFLPHSNQRTGRHSSVFASRVLGGIFLVGTGTGRPSVSGGRSRFLGGHGPSRGAQTGCGSRCGSGTRQIRD